MPLPENNILFYWTAPKGVQFFLQLLPHFGKAETGRTGAPQCAAFNFL